MHISVKLCIMLVLLLLLIVQRFNAAEPLGRLIKNVHYYLIFNEERDFHLLI